VQLIDSTATAVHSIYIDSMKPDDETSKAVFLTSRPEHYHAENWIAASFDVRWLEKNYPLETAHCFYQIPKDPVLSLRPLKLIPRY